MIKHCAGQRRLEFGVYVKTTFCSLAVDWEFQKRKARKGPKLQTNHCRTLSMRVGIIASSYSPNVVTEDCTPKTLVFSLQGSPHERRSLCPQTCGCDEPFDAAAAVPLALSCMPVFRALWEGFYCRVYTVLFRVQVLRV